MNLGDNNLVANPYEPPACNSEYTMGDNTNERSKPFNTSATNHQNGFLFFSQFSTPICHRLFQTHPGPECDELEDAFKGEAHGEGEVHVGEQIPQDERRSVKLNTGKDKTRMKKGLKCVRNYCFSWRRSISTEKRLNLTN